MELFKRNCQTKKNSTGFSDYELFFQIANHNAITWSMQLVGSALGLDKRRRANADVEGLGLVDILVII
jgi:hypothetical protein